MARQVLSAVMQLDDRKGGSGGGKKTNLID